MAETLRQYANAFHSSGEAMMITDRGNRIVNVVATEEEIRDLRIGDKVMLLSKAFQPMLQRISPERGAASTTRA